jgi:predicted acylesterase/phospholipase RssA
MPPSVNGSRGGPELTAFLASIEFFARLDELARIELADQLEPVHLTAGDVLFRQGDAGDGLYLVVSGRVRVSVATRGGERALADLGRGAMVGEIALLSDRPRSASVRALRDTELLKLQLSSFNTLIEQKPDLLGPMARMLVDRLLKADRPHDPPSTGRTVAVAAAGRNPVPAAMLAERLAAELRRTGTVLLVDADVVERDLGAGAAQRGPGDPGRGELMAWLHEAERQSNHVVYRSDADDSAWSRVCLSQSDTVVLAASVRDDPSLGPVEVRALATGAIRCELVLLHDGTPAATQAWLEGRPVADHHHLRADQPGDLARLARMLTGSGCGLVLGGGGARGLAHLGVMQALEEAGVPIDVVGGTSIGAVMGAAYALGLRGEERVERTTRLAQRRLALPTLPIVAMSSGRRVDRLLAEQFGDARIEDLPVRFFCVSASLTRAEEIVHERGPLAQAIRASLSIPGVFPPVYAEGDLLVDGGVLDYVPIDVMRVRVRNGPIVAVDVSPEVEPLTAAPFPASPSGWRLLARRLNLFARHEPVPGVVDIVSRSTALSQVRDRRAVLDDDRVDLLLRPPVARVRSMDFKAGVALIEVGYHHAAEALRDSGLLRRLSP